MANILSLLVLGAWQAVRRDCHIQEHQEPRWEWIKYHFVNTILCKTREAEWYHRVLNSLGIVPTQWQSESLLGKDGLFASCNVIPSFRGSLGKSEQKQVQSNLCLSFSCQETNLLLGRISQGTPNEITSPYKVSIWAVARLLPATTFWAKQESKMGLTTIKKRKALDLSLLIYVSWHSKAKIESLSCTGWKTLEWQASKERATLHSRKQAFSVHLIPQNQFPHRELIFLFNCSHIVSLQRSPGSIPQTYAWHSKNFQGLNQPSVVWEGHFKS